MDNISPTPAVVDTAPANANASGSDAATNAIPGALPGETRAETKERMFKVMVDGQESEVPESELVKGYSHNKAAAKKMEEAANVKKEATEAMRLLRSNPRMFFDKFGIDAKEFAAEIFDRELQEANMTPDQKKLREYEERFAAEAEAERLAAEEYEKQKYQEETEREAADMSGKMIAALNEVGIPNGHRESLYRMVQYTQRAVNGGYIDLNQPIPVSTMQEIARQVKLDYQKDLKSLTGLDDAAIEGIFGSDFIKRVAKSSVKAQPPKHIVPKEVNANRETVTDPFNRSGKISTKDFFKRNR